MKKARSIDHYLARVTGDKRAALERLRRAIRAAAPKAEECMSYGIPSFRVGGRFLVAFGVGANHCAFYPGSTAIEACRRALGKYDTSKGTVRFRAEKPLPAPLVRRLVRARMAAIAG